MNEDQFPIKTGSVLHQLLSMIAVKVAQEFSVKSPATPEPKPKRMTSGSLIRPKGSTYGHRQFDAQADSPSSKT
jgi:hypothetical protein